MRNHEEILHSRETQSSHRHPNVLNYNSENEYGEEQAAGESNTNLVIKTSNNAEKAKIKESSSRKRMQI